MGPLTNQVPCAFKSIHVSTFSQREYLELTRNSRKGTILKQSSVIRSDAYQKCAMPTLEVPRKKGGSVWCETDGFLTTRPLVKRGTEREVSQIDLTRWL